MGVKYDHLVRQDQVSNVASLPFATLEDIGLAGCKGSGAGKRLSDGRGWLRLTQPHLQGAAAVRERSRQPVPSKPGDSVSN